MDKTELAACRPPFEKAWSFAPLAAVLALAMSYVVYVGYRQYQMLYPPGSEATPILVGSDGKAAAVAAELGKARIIVWGQDNLLSAEAAGRPGAVEFVGEALQWLFSEPQRDGGGGAN